MSRLVDSVALPWGLNTEHPMGLSILVLNGLGLLPDDVVLTFAPLESYSHENPEAAKAFDMRNMTAALVERAFEALKLHADEQLNPPTSEQPTPLVTRLNPRAET